MTSSTIESLNVRADRLGALPPYLFIEIDRKRRAKIAAGADVINLGVGDPDRPTPEFIIDEMAKAIRDPANHPYPFDAGKPEFRQAAAEFMRERFGVTVDPQKHILTTIGSKEGIAHLPIGVVNPGDVVLGGDIAYPVYRSSAIFAGATYHEMPLTAANNWLPDLDAIDAPTARKARLLWLNYPGNPTAAVAPLEYFTKTVNFCAEHDIILASDNAYSEIYFDAPPPSIWQTADIDAFPGIEFHSLSKTFNMTGWRIAFAVGNAEVINALAAVKGNSDSGQFNAIQQAGAVALNNRDHPDVRNIVETYRQRRDVLCAGLKRAGINVTPPSASFFVWAPCPSGYDSMKFCARCLDEADIVLVPGAGFGQSGKNYFRAALTVESDRLEQAVDRLQKIDW